jgi:predicted phage gp36 major capsid-like protein
MDFLVTDMNDRLRTLLENVTEEERDMGRRSVKNVERQEIIEHVRKESRMIDDGRRILDDLETVNEALENGEITPEEHQAVVTHLSDELRDTLFG